MDKTVRRLLAWYDGNGRSLPWRVRRGFADPYKVWLSEIMLQQTTAQAVVAYYQKFLTAWPTVQSLAAASLDDVLAAWAGLGYYARARNLHKAAQIVAAQGGRFPDTVEALQRLPGVGGYTAGAIAAIAFGVPAAAMDANAERVIARLFAVTVPLPAAKPRLHELASVMVPADRPGDFVQALMDLGSGPCAIRAPRCLKCPLMADCAARARGVAETLPAKAPRAPKPLKRGAAFVVRDARRVFLVRRPETGLLGGMWQPPLGPWSDEFPSVRLAARQAPCRARWQRRHGFVRHGFTHFDLEIEVYVADAPAGFGPNEGRWASPDELKTLALPTLMRKILLHAFQSG